MSHEPVLRVARDDDAAAIEILMKASIAGLFGSFYDRAQTAASIEHIGHLDRRLLDDGTYFVIEADDRLVACGGWSRRGKLYTGSGDAADDDRIIDPATEGARVRAMFTRPDWARRGLGTRILEACEAAAKAEGFRFLILVGTLAGVPLYERYGFTATEDSLVEMPDGTTIGCTTMTKPID
ncbi:MAG TPA: GNAT family N-acetyltransferase [Candidatus Limnocylindrales bacterium]